MTDWELSELEAARDEALRLRTLTRICIAAAVMALAVPALILAVLL